MPGFEIDGEAYEIPALDTFTLDECEILWDVANMTQEDFEPADPTWPDEKRLAHAEAILEKIANPRFKRAIAEVAYRRKHPEVADELRSSVVGGANMLELSIALILGPGEVSDPTRGSENEPGNVTSISGLSKSADSGSRSESGSSEPDIPLANTGISGSGT